MEGVWASLHIPDSLPGALQPLGPGEGRRGCHLPFPQAQVHAQNWSAGAVRSVERSQANGFLPVAMTPLSKQEA